MSEYQAGKSSNSIESLGRFAGMLLTGLTLLAFAGAINWRIAMLAHLRPHLAIALLLTVFVLLVARSFRLAGLFLIPLLINLSFFVPLWVANEVSTELGETLSITHINLDYDKVDALGTIAEIGSELVFLQELTPPVSAEVTTRMPDYQPIAELPLWTTHGSGLYAREEWGGEVISAEFINLPGDIDRPLLETILVINNREIAILNLHVIRPRSGRTMRILNDSFYDAAVWAQTQQDAGREVIIMGDFNNTPWSPSFRTLLREATLQNGQKGFGMRSTWPSVLPNFLRLPIDHVVHSTGLQTVKHEIGASVRSDHLPLSITLSLQE